jgi:hypothetical protein
VDLRAVDAELGVAIGQGVDRLIFFEPVALETEALAQLVNFGEEDEVDVFLAEVALALRAVDRAIVGRFDQFEDELSLALRAFEDFREHDLILKISTRILAPNGPSWFGIPVLTVALGAL